MDELWTDHLDAMKALRDGIGLRGFAQQDPLVEYKNEGFELFDKFIADIDQEAARRILKIRRVVRTAQPEQEQMQTNEKEVKDVTTGSRELESAAQSVLKAGAEQQSIPRTQPQKTKRNTTNIGRNDKVTVRYADGTEKKGVKYKKVENDVKAGLCTVIGRG